MILQYMFTQHSCASMSTGKAEALCEHCKRQQVPESEPDVINRLVQFTVKDTVTEEVRVYALCHAHFVDWVLAN
jgi:hypothetical protein